MKTKTEITVFGINKKTNVKERLGSFFKNNWSLVSDFTWNYRTTHYSFSILEKEVKP